MESHSNLRHNFSLMDVYTLHKYMLNLKLLTLSEDNFFY